MHVMSRVLLISNSTLYGRGYLDHTEEEIRDFLAGKIPGRPPVEAMPVAEVAALLEP
jgi:peptidase E